MRRPALLLLAASIVACGREPPTSIRPGSASLSVNSTGGGLTGQYLVEFKGNKLPGDLDARVTTLGGTVVDAIADVGVAIVSGLTSDAANRFASSSDVATFMADVVLAPRTAEQRVFQTASTAAIAEPSSATHPELAALFPYQWNMRVIHADRAWQAGLLGSPAVRLAVIDFGIDPAAPDLAPLIDATRSTSFCPSENAAIAQFFPGYPTWSDLEGHGSWVASIAASRGTLVAGVTSRTSLMAVKALSQSGCPFSSLFRAIAYAADNGADVINMSIGLVSLLPKSGTQGFAHFFHLSVQYALVKGVSAVVVAAGNDGFDLDHDGSAFDVFCDVPGVICVSATGPTSAGPNDLGPFIDIDAPAFYTQFGASAINVAAPGGNASFDAAGHLLGISRIYGVCASTTLAFVKGAFVPTPCTGRTDFALGQLGTSAASPHAAGLAALLVSQLGHGHQAQVRSAMLNSADDLGKPGHDPFYGQGRINVAKAVGLP